jgi:hypothetical protein
MFGARQAQVAVAPFLQMKNSTWKRFYDELEGEGGVSGDFNPKSERERLARRTPPLSGNPYLSAMARSS